MTTQPQQPTEPSARICEVCGLPILDDVNGQGERGGGYHTLSPGRYMHHLANNCIPRLKAENARLKAEVSSFKPMSDEELTAHADAALKRKIESLKAELEAARKDAERKILLLTRSRDANVEEVFRLAERLAKLDPEFNSPMHLSADKVKP